jgi:hypothetical protein
MKKNTTSYSAFLVDNKLLFKYIMNTKGSLCDGETFIKFFNYNNRKNISK